MIFSNFYLSIFDNYIFNHTIYPLAFYWRMWADFFASKNSSLTYSIYYLVISVFPLVLARTEQGVSN